MHADGQLFGMMQQWAGLVEDAQQPILMSARDGKLLKPVPREQRLSPDKLATQVESAVQKQDFLAAEARRALCQAWVRGTGCIVQHAAWRCQGMEAEGV